MSELTKKENNSTALQARIQVVIFKSVGHFYQTIMN